MAVKTERESERRALNMIAGISTSTPISNRGYNSVITMDRTACIIYVTLVSRQMQVVLWVTRRTRRLNRGNWNFATRRPSVQYITLTSWPAAAVLAASETSDTSLMLKQQQQPASHGRRNAGCGGTMSPHFWDQGGTGGGLMKAIFASTADSLYSVLYK